MQSLTEKVFKLAPPGGLFDETVVHNLFPGSSDGARALLVHRACQAGEILRLKPGLFVLDLPYRKQDLHPFVLAARLRHIAGLRRGERQYLTTESLEEQMDAYVK